jgi:phasin
MANPETKSARTAKAGAEKTIDAAKSFTDAAFSYPTFEFPEAFRSFAEQGLTQTREAYANMKANAEEATDLIEEGFEAARANARDFQFKALDLAKDNTDATFDLFRKLLTTHSVADAMQLQTQFARERFEAFVDYSKDVQAVVSKASAEVSKPAKTLLDKTLSFPKAA